MAATQPANPYEVIEVVQEGVDYSIRRARRARDSRNVLLKIQRASNQGTEHLRSELEVGRSLDPAVALHPLEVSTFAGSSALVLEDFAGEPIEQLMGAPMELTLVLRIGIQLASCLEAVHSSGLVHRDLKPQNVYFDPRSGEVKLTGFGIAITTPGEHWASSEAIEGTLPYMSPEQTGRINRPIDVRSDLYSVGVILYEMLTGFRPFEPRDALGWVHCHVAQAPRPLAGANVPRPVSGIVLKLLQKLPEERYQTAAGLHDDLTRCLEEWNSAGAVSSFVIGQNDFSSELRIPKRLYGMERATDVLANAFERVRAQGTPGLVLVSGPAGSGKSSFTRSIDEPVARAHGIFATGKFERTVQTAPYSGISSAIRDVLPYILAEGTAGLRAWRSRLTTALGRFGQLVVDLVKPLERIIGKQPAIPELPLEGAQSRFYLAFGNFFSALATSARPLVLFLDDLQWADGASLALIEHLVTRPETGHVLLVGAYTDTNLTPGDPLLGFVQRMRDRKAVVEIALPPLGLEHVTQLCADTLSSTTERAEPLGRLIWERTDGNPLRVTQLLTNLHRDRVLVFDRKERTWRWDLELVRNVSMHEDVVDRTLARIGELPPATRTELELAACIGGRFDARTLSVVTGASLEATHQALRAAVGLGLLASVGNVYHFLHDRIRDAVYEGISTDRRIALHAHIGRSLRDRVGGSELEEQIFDVAAQLNLAEPLLTARHERDQVAHLDMLAGRKAKTSSAYAAAASYFAKGTSLLDASSWQEHYELAFGLHLEWARCELLLGHLEEARRLATVVLEHGRSSIDRANARLIHIDILLFEEQGDAAVAIAIASLASLGVDLSPHPAREELLAAQRAVCEELRVRSIEAVADLPRLRDPVVEAAMATLTALFPVAYVTDPNLHNLVVCRLMDLSLRHGLASASALGCAAFAMELLTTLGRTADARKLGEVALRLARRREFLAHSAKTLAVLGAFVAPRTGPLSAALDLQRTAFRTAMELGDLTYGCIDCLHIVETRLARGDRLDDVERELRIVRPSAEKVRFSSIAQNLRCQLAFIQNLQGRTRTASTFTSADFDEEELQRRWDRMLPITRAWFHVHKLQALYLHRDHRGAALEAALARPRISAITGLLAVANYHLFAGLTHAALAREAAGANQLEHLKELADHQEALARWAESCPENFLYMHALVSAERSHVAGDTGAAIRLYEQAIRSAHDNALLSGEALAYETASTFYRGLGLQAFADLYLREARSRYLEWGAHAKVRALDAQVPHLVHVRAPPPLTATISTREHELDLLSVLKVSQVLSTEVVRSRLLYAVTQLLSEQASARRSVFLSVRGEHWTIESATGPGTGVPEAIINHVLHSRDRVLLQDASLPGPYSADPYVAARRPRSVLCFPIVRQAELLGIIYLENNLVPAAFTEDKVAVLELLAEQAAIAIENAKLHSEQLREIAERQQAEATLQSVLDNMVDAVFVCDRAAYVTLANPAGMRLCGFATPGEAHIPVEEVASRLHAVHPDGTPFARDELPLLRALAGEVLSSVDMSIRDARTGRTAYLRMSAAPLQDERGAIAGAVTVAVNVTEAIELDLLKEQFIRVVAHELKTPVAVVKGYAEVLRRTAAQATEKEGRLLRALVRGADRIDQLVTDLLLLWQLQTGRLVLAIEEHVDLVDLVKRVVRRFESETGSHVTIKASRPVVVAVDRQLLEKAVGSLVDNALRYSPAGNDVAIELTLLDEGAILAVKDHGIGIPPAKQAHLFEPFFRAHTDTPYDAGGLGLGLYVAKAIAALHGGTIVAETKEGEGSTFQITLPRRAAAAVPARSS